MAAAATACGEPFVVLGDTPGIMRIVIGVGDSIGTRVDSVATRTRLTDPTAVAFDAGLGLLYAADRGALRQAGGVTTRVARVFSVSSTGRATLLLDAGGCTQGPCLLQPTAMAVAPNGSLIIADQVGNRVFRYVPGAALTVIAGNGTAATAEDGAVAATSPINRPGGVTVGNDGRIYISESGAHRIRVIGADGLLVTIAGTGERGHSGHGGPATEALLNEPTGIVHGDGVLYFAEHGSHTIRSIGADGSITTIAGVAGSVGFAGDGGDARSALLNTPYAVALTTDRRQLFFSDLGNDRVRTVDLTTGLIRTFAGTGSRTYAGNRRLAGETALFRPSGLDASSTGFLFVTDPGHSVVWRTSVAVN